MLLVCFSLNSRHLSIVGLAFLPFLWFINVVWFFKEAFCRDSFPGQAKMKGGIVINDVFIKKSLACHHPNQGCVGCDHSAIKLPYESTDV